MSLRVYARGGIANPLRLRCHGEQCVIAKSRPEIQSGLISEVADAIRRDHMPNFDGTNLGTTVLLTGAGCSASAGVPIASEIAKELSVRLAIRYQLVDSDVADCDLCAQKLLEAGRLKEAVSNNGKVDWAGVYDEIFTHHYKTPKETRNVFSEILDGRTIKLNWTHLCIGELVRLGYLSTVLTTNFDQLALEGMARSGRLPVVADGVESLNRITGRPTHPQLIQIHGSRHTYRLRNSSDDVAELAEEGGAIHAIDELMQAATVFLVAGYGGKEKGLMRLLIDGAKRFPDTQIFWVSHGKKIDGLSELAVELLQTSKYSRVLLDQDADHFFYSLLQEMGLNSPKIIDDPLFAVGQLKDSLAESRIPAIESMVAAHQQKVEKIQSIFDPVALGENRDPSDGRSRFDEAKIQAVERLAAGAASEFNNVLTTTMGYSDLLLRKHPLGDPSHDDILAIRQSADRAAGLVGKLFAFASSLKLQPQKVDLNKVISDLAIDLKKFVGGRVVIEYDLSTDLWPVFVDVSEIEKVLVNLVENAGEAILASGTVKIATSNVFLNPNSDVKTVSKHSSVLVEVIDSGMGIDPAIGDRIFDPFFSTKTKQDAGMGLSSVFGIVKQSGGEICYESEVGKGTKFQIYLPRHMQPVQHVEFSPIKRLELQVKDSAQRLVALCVEDEPAVRDYTVRALKELGIVALVSSSGNEALRMYDSLLEDTTFVISDAVMPDGDGQSLLKSLRSRGYDGPFILTSGHSEEEIRQTVSSDLGALFLPKPFTVNQLREAVEKVLRRRTRVGPAQ